MQLGLIALQLLQLPVAVIANRLAAHLLGADAAATVSIAEYTKSFYTKALFSRLQ